MVTNRKLLSRLFFGDSLVKAEEPLPYNPTNWDAKQGQIGGVCTIVGTTAFSTIFNSRL